MIKLTKNNGVKMYFAASQVVLVHKDPGCTTEVEMVGGKIYLVQEGPEEVAQKVEAEINGTN